MSKKSTNERWRKIPDFPLYSVSTHGRVKGPHGLMHPNPQNRYLAVKIWNKDGPAMRRINRLVATVFIGPPPSRVHQSAHWDGNKINNRLSNIRWATPQENSDDKLRHGTVYQGDKHDRAILTAKKVLLIRSLHANHMAKRRAQGRVRPYRGFFVILAARHHVSVATILDVMRLRSWKFLIPERYKLAA